MKISLFNIKFCIVLTLIHAFAFVNSVVAFVDLEAQSIVNTNRPPDGIFHPEEQFFQVRYTIYNGGDETSDDYTIEIYIGDYFVGSSPSPRVGLEPQRDRSALLTLPYPIEIPLGSHTLRMKILCPNDDTPNNNEVSGAEVIVAEKGPPDLKLSDFGVPENLFYGTDTVTVGCYVENIGHSDSDSYTVDFYIDGYNVGSENRSGIVGHRSDGWFYPKITLPYDCPEGTHLITAELTCSNDSNLGNNSAQDSIRVGKSVPTSISIGSVDVDGNVYSPGESIVVIIEIEGIGGHLDTSFEVDVYASSDFNITPDDYKIYRYDSDTISPGETQYLIDTYQLPSDILVGDYYIGIIVTYPVEDGTESQQAWDSSTVHIGIYDLVIQTIEITPGQYSPGDELVVYTLIKNGSELSTEGYAVDFYVSTDAVITADDNHIGYVEREGLAPGQQHSYETTCLIPYNLTIGNYYVGAIITCPIGTDMAKNTKCSEETIELVQSGSCVSGQMLYLNRDRRIEFPIRYALVEVYDADDNEDPNDDRVIGRTHTDKDGNYNVVVLNYEMSSQNIYVKVFADSPIGAYPEAEGKVCSVRDDIFDEIYYMKSDLYPHPGEESVVINMTADRKGGEFMVYDSIIEGFHKAKTFFDINLPEVTTFWPSEEETSYFDPCDLSMHIAQGDRGDRDVIMHEYGHFVADVFAFAQGPVGDDSAHYWNADLRNYPLQRTDEQARNLTFCESWATIFSIATQYGDTSYPYAGDTFYQDQDEESDSEFKVDLEKDTDKKREPGEFYEHMNCCALWDIFDDNDDRVDDHDTLSDPNLSKIWAVLRTSKPDDIKDFWDGWFACYDDYTSEITRIFQDHKMSFVKPNIPVQPPIPNTPPVADAGPDQTVEQTFSGGVNVQLDGSGSYDPDGDPLEYEWYLPDGKSHGKSPTPRFRPGVWTVTLYVYDGDDYDSDTVIITVIPTDPSTWED